MKARWLTFFVVLTSLAVVLNAVYAIVLLIGGLFSAQAADEFMGSTVHLILTFLSTLVWMAVIIYILAKDLVETYEQLNRKEKKQVDKALTGLAKTVASIFLEKHPKANSFFEEWKKNTA